MAFEHNWYASLMRKNYQNLTIKRLSKKVLMKFTYLLATQKQDKINTYKSLICHRFLSGVDLNDLPPVSMSRFIGIFLYVRISINFKIIS